MDMEKQEQMFSDRQNGGQSGEDTASQCSLFFFLNIIQNHRRVAFYFWLDQLICNTEVETNLLNLIHGVWDFLMSQWQKSHSTNRSHRYRSRASHQTLISAFNLGAFASTDVLFEGFRSSWDFYASQSGEKNNLKEKTSWSVGEKNAFLMMEQGYDNSNNHSVQPCWEEKQLNTSNLEADAEHHVGFLSDQSGTGIWCYNGQGSL